MRVMTLIFSALLCLTCSDRSVQGPTAPTTRPVQSDAVDAGRRRAVTRTRAATALSGQWGGEHISLELQDGVGRLELDCAHGKITQAIVPASDGSFAVLGTFTREHGGPVSTTEEENVRPARYSGTVSGDAMTLAIAVDGQELPDKFTLTKGQSPRLTKCL